MKYIAIIDEEMLSNFRIDDPPCYMPEDDKILVVKDVLGYIRGIQLMPLPKGNWKSSNCGFTIHMAIKSLEAWDKFSDEIEELLDKQYCEKKVRLKIIWQKDLCNVKKQ